MSRSTKNKSLLVLSDYLLLICLARISRWYYPTLSLVSKKFRSLVASPELYKFRSLFSHTESCLYVFLYFHPEPNPRLFTLYLKPNRTLPNETSKKSNGYVFTPISSPHCAQADTFGLVTVGSDIYQIGGLINNKPSSRVSVLDCRFNTWHEAPKMHVAREKVAAHVVDGKIYVVGGGKDVNSSNWMEVFDPKTQAWEFVLCPDPEMYKRHITNTAVVDGDIYIFNHDNTVLYNPKKGTWEAVRNVKWDLAYYSYCKIKGVLYSFWNGFQWYDTKIEKWRMLKGLEELQLLCIFKRLKLMDYGGKMMVLWNNYVPDSAEIAFESCANEEILCAEIALEKCDNEEIVGKVEWSHVMLETPMFCAVSSVCAVTL